MYRQNLDKRDRGSAAIAVVAIHAVLFFALLNLSGRIDLADPQRVMDVFDVREVQPQPEPPPVVPEQREEMAEPEEGEASPPNIRSQATPVVAPRPEISLPVPVPMATTQTPGEGTDATQGAADVPGPGTGAGGAGTGTGGGGAGTGPGGGGGEGTRPSIAWPPYPHLSGGDYPTEMRRRWPRGGRVFAVFRVQVNGRATDCRIDRSFGDAQIDAWTCHLIETKLRFNPARRPDGQPYVTFFGYAQAPVRN